jgi:hypothetical protein
MKSVKVPVERWLQESYDNGPWTHFQLAIAIRPHRRQISEIVQSIEDWFLGKSPPRKSGPTKDGLRVLAENISAALDSSSNEEEVAILRDHESRQTTTQI